MNKMKVKWIILSILSILTYWNNLKGQAINTANYKLAFGVRAGETSGIDIKYNTNNNSSIEGILGLWNNAASFTGLYEKSVNILNAPGLIWYYGIGGHVSFTTETYNIGTRKYRAAQDAGFGVDGIFGIEYKILPIPFVISFDLKPFIEIKTKGDIFLAFDPGIGIKFTF